MLTALFVQKILLDNIEDDKNIAYGYTLERNTVEIYFSYGKLIREEFTYDRNGERQLIRLDESEFFNGEFFFRSMKRWYANRTNKNLVELFKTFNNPLSLVD